MYHSFIIPSYLPQFLTVYNLIPSLLHYLPSSFTHFCAQLFPKSAHCQYYWW